VLFLIILVDDIFGLGSIAPPPLVSKREEETGTSQAGKSAFW
jgi:hypothetical protein